MEYYDAGYSKELNRNVRVCVHATHRDVYLYFNVYIFACSCTLLTVYEVARIATGIVVAVVSRINFAAYCNVRAKHQ